MKIILVSDSWKYFAQGNANILLKNDEIFPGKLLRLRKKGPTSLETYLFHENEIYPRFGGHAVNMELVQLGPGFVDYVHEIYEERSSSTPDHGKTLHGLNSSLISDSSHGLLIDYIGFQGEISGLEGTGLVRKSSSLNSMDSTGGAGAGSVLHRTVVSSTSEEILFTGLMLEFKPKWLLQSPSAPPGAIRCRNCALAVHRTGKLPAFCRLDLVSDDDKKVYRALESLFESFGGSTLVEEVDETSPSLLADITTEFLRRNDILQRIKAVQALDSRGILGHSDDEEIGDDFLMAMTFRDCTMLIQIARYDVEVGDEREEELKSEDYLSIVRYGKTYFVRAKLVDLDSKRASRRDHWAKTERALLDFYQ